MKSDFVSILKLSVITCLLFTSGLAQRIQTDDSKLLLKTAGPIEIGPYKIFVTDRFILDQNSVLFFEIPRSMKCDWSMSEVIIKDKNGDSRTVRPVIKKRKLSFNLPIQVNWGDYFEISGLQIRNLYHTMSKEALIFYIEDGEKIKTNSGKIFNLWDKISKFEKLREGEYSVIDLDFDLESNVKYIIAERVADFPDINLKVNGRHSFIPAGRTIKIRFPENVATGLMESSCNIEGLGGYDHRDCRIRWKNDGQDKLLELYFKKRVKAGKGIRLVNLKFDQRSQVFDKTPVKLELGDYSGGSIQSLKNICVCNPKTDLLDHPRIILNLPAAEMPTIFINTGNSGNLLDVDNELCFQLPAEMGLYWDRSVTAVKINDELIEKIDTKVYYPSETVAYLRIIKKIDAHEELRIDGLRIGIRRTIEKESDENIFQKAYLKVMFNGVNHPEAEKDIWQDIQIAHFSMRSRSRQEFAVRDPLTMLHPVEINIESNFSVFKPDDRLILQIPDDLHMVFARNQSAVHLSGSMREYINDVSYLNSKNLILNIQRSIPPRTKLIIEGIQCESFGRNSNGKLLLFHQDATSPIARDENDWMIASPSFTIADDQKIFDRSDKSKGFELIIRTQEYTNYYRRGKKIRIMIPTDVPVSFYPDMAQIRLDKVSRRFLNPQVAFINDKTIEFTIIRDIPARICLRISEIYYGRPYDVSVSPDVLYMSVNDGFSFVPSQKNISVVSSRSNCNQADHFCRLVESNFNKGDTLILQLNGSQNLQWDIKNIEKALTIEQSTPLIDPHFISFKDYQKIGFNILRSFEINDQIRFNGLILLNSSNRRAEAVLEIPYHNFYGKYTAGNIYNNRDEKYSLPIACNQPVQVKRLSRMWPDSSYYAPMIRCNDKGFAEIAAGYSGKSIILPEIILQNGRVIYDHQRINNTFKRALNNVPELIDQGDMETAEEEAIELNRNCPDLWYGYYSLAQVYRENPNRIAEARRLYREAKRHGYVSSDKYPQLFQDNSDDEMNQYIAEGRQYFEKRNYIAAEEKFLLYQDLRDSLREETIGKAYYWLGRVAYNLKDYPYAINYFNYSINYSYFPAYDDDLEPADYYIAKSNEMLARTEKLITDIPIEPPVPPEDQNIIYISLIKPDKRHDPIILDGEFGPKRRYFFGEPIEIHDQEHYEIKFRPVGNAMKNLSWTIFTGAVLWVFLFI